MAKARLFVTPRNSRNQTKILTATTSNAGSELELPAVRISSRRFRFALSTCALIVASLCSSGCCFMTSGSGNGWINRFMEQQVACMRDHVWAQRAYHLRFGHLKRPHAHDFRDGFIDGYCDICDGGQGGTPALPPEKYWSFRYRSQEGAEMQNAWFAGYEAGSQSAKHDGAQSFHKVQLSKEVEEALMAAQEIKEHRAGVHKTYVMDMAPIKSGPQIMDQEMVVGSPTITPRTNAPSTPSSNATFSSDKPQPMQTVPVELPDNPSGTQQ